MWATAVTYEADSQSVSRKCVIVEGEGETGSQSQHVAGMFVLCRIVTMDMLVLGVSKGMFLQESDKQRVCVLQESVTNSVEECLTENPLTLRPAKRPAQLDSPASNLDGLPTPLVPQVSIGRVNSPGVNGVCPTDVCSPLCVCLCRYTGSV